MNEPEKNKKKNTDTDTLLCIVKRGETIRIPLSDIIYVESSAHKLYVHTSDQMFQYNDKMNNLSNVLEKQGFIRCHQSYLVRVNAVSSIRAGKIVVEGNEIQVSRKYKDSVKKALTSNNSTGENEKAYVTEADDINAGSLKCVNGPYTGKVYGLVPGKEIIIGRDGDSCDIVINLPKVSRKHFCIIYHDKRRVYEIIDLSTNGTFVNNDVRLQKNVHYEVEPGEKIDIGDGAASFKLL